MKTKICALILGALSFAGVALAATGPAVLTWTRPTTYTDGSPMPASDITAYGVQCTLTPTGGTAAPCVLSSATLAGNVITGSLTVTYPAQGARACFRLVTRVGTRESDPSNESCKDFAPLTPSPPTNVTITISVSLSITVNPDGSVSASEPGVTVEKG
jgi:hypothetical protein